MAVEKGKRIVDQNSAITINNDDVLVIDSETRGTRKIKYSDLCSAVAMTLGIADIKSTADGAMAKSVYDADGDGVVDNAKKVDGHTVSKDLPADAKLTDTVYDDTAVKKSITDEVARAKKAERANSDAIALKMTTKTYDADGDGVVDNAKKVDGHTVSKDLLADAKLTDTVYDDTAVKKSVTDEVARAKKAEQANADAIALKMTTKTYDADGDGVVDNAAKVNSHSVESNVPANAVFTDTVYDDSVVKKSITDETDRAKKAEEANTQLTNDLKTGLTSGTVKVAKATSADSASALGRVSTMFFTIPDNGARKKYLLFYDITDWISKSSNAGTYAYDGYFFSRRSGGFVSNNYTGTLSMVASYNGMSGSTPIKSDDSQSLRLRTTSEMYKPVILHNTSTNKYYLALETYGNGRDLVLFGIFQGTFVGTWVQNVGQSLTPGTLPDGYELYSEGYVSIPYERAIADKNGNDIAGTYIKDLSASGNTITYTRGDGTTGNITIGS